MLSILRAYIVYIRAFFTLRTECEEGRFLRVTARRHHRSTRFAVGGSAHELHANGCQPLLRPLCAVLRTDLQHAGWRVGIWATFAHFSPHVFGVCPQFLDSSPERGLKSEQKSPGCPLTPASTTRSQGSSPLPGRRVWEGAPFRQPARHISIF